MDIEARKILETLLDDGSTPEKAEAFLHSAGLEVGRISDQHRDCTYAHLPAERIRILAGLLSIETDWLIDFSFREGKLDRILFEKQITAP